MELKKFNNLELKSLHWDSLKIDKILLSHLILKVLPTNISISVF